MGNLLPWNSSAACQNLVDNVQKNRLKVFDEVRAVVDKQDPELRDEILSLSLMDLRDALQQDQYTAQTVLKAYSWKALQVQDAYNCINEFLLESFQQAEAIDTKYSNQPNKPALYGIPFSVKGNFFLKGYDSCIGFSQFLNSPKENECSFVTHLRNLGAVPFVYTNVPQALLSFMCSNPVYGTTSNPYDVQRSPGGSSGGEACLLAAGGTPFAIGSDVAGSLRIPAAFCGLTTLKPGQERFVVLDSHGGVPGRGRLGLSFGFFTKSVDEQIFLLELVFGSEDYRKLVPKHTPIPMKLQLINEVAEKKPLRIGYFTNDGFMKPTPACARVVQDTVNKLRAEGHELVHFRVPTPEHAASILYKCVLPEGGAYFVKLFNNDLVDPYMKQFATMLKVPKVIRWLASYPLSYLSPQAAIISCSFVQSAEDVRMAQESCDSYIEKFAAHWHELQLDGLICPSFVVPSVPHKYPSQLGACAFATGLFNLLDYPAGLVPTGKVTKQDDEDLMDEEKWPTDQNFVLKIVRNAAADSAGLPLGVQVVTLPYEEEQCLGLMKLIENLWK
uniref:Amidase domain-containing protein n=1 Tax=Ditylenchus dipsaci TaxID=166011 RepID=A0A915E9G8_9BILA